MDPNSHSKEDKNTTAVKAAGLIGALIPKATVSLLIGLNSAGPVAGGLFAKMQGAAIAKGSYMALA